MKTKAKAKKATPAKTSIKAKPAKAPAKAPEPAIQISKEAQCTSLAETGVLVFEIGTDDSGETYYRITANNAGGFWSNEWVAWTDIYAVCSGNDSLTSIMLRGLFKGKSVNTAGFLMAALKQEGLVQRKAGKVRLYSLTEEAHKRAPASAA